MLKYRAFLTTQFLFLSQFLYFSIVMFKSSPRYILHWLPCLPLFPSSYHVTWLFISSLSFWSNAKSLTFSCGAWAEQVSCLCIAFVPDNLVLSGSTFYHKRLTRRKMISSLREIMVPAFQVNIIIIKIFSTPKHALTILEK